MISGIELLPVFCPDSLYSDLCREQNNVTHTLYRALLYCTEQVNILAMKDLSLLLLLFLLFLLLILLLFCFTIYSILIADLHFTHQSSISDCVVIP